MTKKTLLTGLFVLVFAVCTSNISMAAPEKVQPKNCDCPPACQCKKNNIPPQNMKRPPHPSKEEMEAKKAEFENRLNLTDEQKQKIKENKKKDIEKIKPVMKQIHEKKHELMEIKNNNELSQEEKDKKINSLKKDIKKLRLEEKKFHEQNMKNFEAILTPEQKAEFAKIKAEQKKEMKERKEHFKEMQRFNNPAEFPDEPRPLPR